MSEKVSPEVVARREWRKFGDALANTSGQGSNSKLVPEPVFLKLSLTKDHDRDNTKTSVVAAKNIACRYCQGAHWSAKCPHKDAFAEEVKEAAAASAAIGMDDTGKLKYIPPSLRRSMEAGGPSVTVASVASMVQRDNPNTVRLSNLAEITSDADIRELVGRIASFTRVYVTKDQMTGLCRGSAYISFTTVREAETVIQKLDGYYYGNLVIRAEMAKPQQP